MAKETAKRDALDELFSSVSVRDTLDMVNGGNDDGMEWVPRRKTDDSHKEEQQATNNKEEKKSDNNDEKKKKVLPSADRKKTGGKRTGQQRRNTAKSAPDSPTRKENLTGGSYWETFLLKFNERKGRKNKDYTRAVLMPNDIIDALQAYFGRHSADILCILVEELFESERDNLRKYISQRMNIITKV